MPEPATRPGNNTDEQNLANPISRRLVSRFDEQILKLVRCVPTENVLDVGCGEGFRTAEFSDKLPARRVVGIDVESEVLRRHWGEHKQVGRPNLEFIVGDAAAIPFGDAEFDLVTAIDVLEHVSDPDVVLSEIRRVCSGYLVASVPREPLWRMMNLACGEYVHDWVNAEGHIQHWSTRRFTELLRRHGRIVSVHKPIPWTIALVDVS